MDGNMQVFVFIMLFGAKYECHKIYLDKCQEQI